MGRKVSLAVNVLLFAAGLAYLACYDAFLAGYVGRTFTAFPIAILWVLAVPALFFSSAGLALRLRDWLVGRGARSARAVCAIVALLAGFAPLAAASAGVSGLMGRTGIALSAALFACSGVLAAPVAGQAGPPS